MPTVKELLELWEKVKHMSGDEDIVFKGIPINIGYLKYLIEHLKGGVK
jgi:hypothetical protein